MEGRRKKASDRVSVDGEDGGIYGTDTLVLPYICTSLVCVALSNCNPGRRRLLEVLAAPFERHSVNAMRFRNLMGAPRSIALSFGCKSPVRHPHQLPSHRVQTRVSYLSPPLPPPPSLSLLSLPLIDRTRPHATNSNVPSTLTPLLS